MSVPRFDGEVETRWLVHEGDDRAMTLLTDFTFVDSRDVAWRAPAGACVDGASIPPSLWSGIVGTPYVGDYRRATVIHDVACQERTRPYEEVHYMFYEAMLCDGVAPERAWLMYTAVRLFGPKWPETESRRRARRALRRFPIRRLADTLDAALGERTTWQERRRARSRRGGSSR